MSDPSICLDISRIKDSNDLPVPPFPQPPDLSKSGTPTREKLKLIQAYITSLEYNYTGEEYFVKKMDRGYRHVTSTAKLIIREALPIQCVEAVFLGLYLTADMSEVDRFPVCFRSSLDGRVYRHIILAVRSGNVWGALGLSRRDTLMYKELKYELFSRLMGDFRDSYAGCWHRLDHIWVGFPMPHDISSNVPVKWKVMRADVGTESEWLSAAPKLDSFVACANSLSECFSITGKIPDHPLVANNTEDGPSSLSPSNTAGHGRAGGVGRGGAGNDPRGSPGARSPGVRSPGLPPSWLGPGNGGGRRRASTPVGQGTARMNKFASGGGSSGGGGRQESFGKGARARLAGGSRIGSSIGSGSDGGVCCDGTSGATIVASPPRPRSSSVVLGSARASGRSPRGRSINKDGARRNSNTAYGGTDAGADSAATALNGGAALKLLSPPPGNRLPV